MWTRIWERGAWDKQSGEVLTRSLARVETRVAVCGPRGHEAGCQRDARVDVVTGGGDPSSTPCMTAPSIPHVYFGLFYINCTNTLAHVLPYWNRNCKVKSLSTTCKTRTGKMQRHHWSKPVLAAQPKILGAMHIYTPYTPSVQKRLSFQNWAAKLSLLPNDKNTPINDSLTLQLCSVIITALETEDTMLEICDESCGGVTIPHAGFLFFLYGHDSFFITWDVVSWVDTISLVPYHVTILKRRSLRDFFSNDRSTVFRGRREYAGLKYWINKFLSPHSLSRPLLYS